MSSKHKSQKNPLKQKRSYTLRDLSKKNHTKVLNYFKDIESNSDALNKLKRPGELWYFTLFGNRSVLFDDIELAAQKANEWTMSAQQPQHGSQYNIDLIHGVKFVKFGKPAASFEDTELEFSKVREKAREKARSEKQQLIEKTKTILNPTKKKGQPNLGVSGLLAKSSVKMQEQASQISKLQKQMSALKSQLKKLKAATNGKAKPTSKKAATKQKATKKIQSKKKAPSKNKAKKSKKGSSR